MINPALTDSQLWGAGARDIGEGDVSKRNSSGRKIEKENLAKRELDLLKVAIQTVINEIDGEGEDRGDYELVSPSVQDKVQLPMHIEVRALGTHLLAVRARHIFSKRQQIVLHIVNKLELLLLRISAAALLRWLSRSRTNVGWCGVSRQRQESLQSSLWTRRRLMTC